MSDGSNDEDFDFQDVAVHLPRIIDHDDKYDDDLDSLDEENDEGVEDEPESDYEIGGYHPVNLGDVFNSRYFVLRKLGWGHFATVWLAYDSTQTSFVAIKIPKSRSDFAEAAKDEMDILTQLREGDSNHVGYHNIVHVLNQFDFIGVSRSFHLCMVFEVLGDNLLFLIRRFGALDVNFCRVISRQMLQGLSYMHDACSIIHTDIKPENVVICLTAGQLNNIAIEAFKMRNNPDMPQAMKSTAPDTYRQKYLQGLDAKQRKKMRKQRKKHRDRVEAFLNKLEEQMMGFHANGTNGHEKPEENGNSINGVNFDPYDNVGFFLDELQAGNMHALKEVRVKIVDFGNACRTDHHFTEEIQTREYRCPEAILGSEYDTSSDIWSTGCLIFELVTGEYLFYPMASSYDGFDIDDDHMAKMIEFLGPIPGKLFRDGRRYRDIFDRNGKLLRIKKLEPKSIVQLLMEIGNLPGTEAKAMSDFLMPMFAYDIHKRATAKECLESKWLELTDTNESKRRRMSNSPEKH
uniref:Protein kinase domain-containing protein n=1 Tax=Panagrolaimus sp. JU765 TaxID=591449 RepID=A0AC34RNP4_9BILA